MNAVPGIAQQGSPDWLPYDWVSRTPEKKTGTKVERFAEKLRNTEISTERWQRSKTCSSSCR